MTKAPPLSVERTACVLDCPDACHLEVEASGGRVVRVRGVAGDRNTQGFICSKVARLPRRLYHRQRLLQPMRRRGPKGAGQFHAISWDEAIAEVTARFRDIRQRWGGEAILPFHYGGSNGLMSEGLLDDLYFARLGASRLIKSICALPTTLVARGMYGKMPGVAFQDYAHARCIVIWGANPKVSNIHLVPHLRAAREGGAWIAVIDPRANFSATEVDLHLPVLPGADLPLALALIHHWERRGRLDEAFLHRHTVGGEGLLRKARAWSLERGAAAAGVEVADLERLAEVWADTDPAVLRCGWGLERNRNGGASVAAVLAIPALLGKFGVRGGGYTLSNSGGLAYDRSSVLGFVDWRTRALNMTQLGRLLDHANAEVDPPVQGLFVYNANPAVTVPNQPAVLRGLAREDLFTVVFEQVMTDTALYADILLPATSFLEAYDVKAAYGHYVAAATRPVVPAPGEARSNPAVFAHLGRAMGFDDEAFTASEEALMGRVAAALTPPRGELDGDRLLAGGPLSYRFADAPDDPAPVQFANVWPRTRDEKVDLCPAVLGPEPYEWIPVDSGFPLALVTPASARLVNSTFGESWSDTFAVTLHPEEAQRRRLANGDRVRVHNAQGEVHCRLRVSRSVRPGVAVLPKGVWRQASLNGSTATALCPDHVQVVGGAACFNDARVEVEKLAAAPSPTVAG